MEENRKTCFLGATTGLPAFHHDLSGVSSDPVPGMGEGERGALGPMVVCRLTCEIWVIHHPVLSFSWELMAFEEGSVAGVCAIPHRSWDAAAATLQAPALSPWEHPL